MRTLILFFWRNRFFTFFIVLEVVSLLLLFKSYSYQRSLAFNTVNDVTGKLYKISSGISDYFNLKEQNRQLARENMQLKNLLQKAAIDVTDTAALPYDTADFYFISAKVVSNSVNKRNNYIMVDKGSRDGIKKEMAAVSADGLAGVVIGVSPHYALIMSMLHKNADISARIKKNNQLVRVVWDTDDYRFGTVEDIPSHLNLQKGDTIVTSGNSLIFPAGIPIGTVEKFFPTDRKSLTRATLRFATDFNGLFRVYIIKNRNRTEERQLMEETAP